MQAGHRRGEISSRLLATIPPNQIAGNPQGASLVGSRGDLTNMWIRPD